MNRNAGRKRSATEPAVDLLAPEHEIAATAKRPSSIVLGALLVFGRGIAGIAWIAAFALLWKEIAAEADVSADLAPVVFWIVLGVGLVGALVLFALAFAIWRGSNFARVLVMLSLTISIATAAVGYFMNGEEITVQTTLLTVSFDILVLLALSSNDARAWSRRRRG